MNQNASPSPLPELTDWTAPPNRVTQGLQRALFVAGRADKRRRRNHELQQALLEEESKREPAPDATDREVGRWRRFVGVKCDECGRPDALVEIDRKGVLRQGYTTSRCAFCLAWQQTLNASDDFGSVD